MRISACTTCTASIQWSLKEAKRDYDEKEFRFCTSQCSMRTREHRREGCLLACSAQTKNESRRGGCQTATHNSVLCHACAIYHLSTAQHCRPVDRSKAQGRAYCSQASEYARELCSQPKEAAILARLQACATTCGISLLNRSSIPLSCSRAKRLHD